MSKYLFIGAHHDDIELCCGATVFKIIPDNEIKFVIFSSHYHGNENILNEFEQSMKLFDGVGCQVFGFNSRVFEPRQSILQNLIDIRDEYKPDVIFTHSHDDIHQAHSVIGQESLRAFKKENLITYKGLWNQFTDDSNYFIEVSEENMAKKLDAMACYKSQQHRQPYFSKEFTYARALLAGAKIGVKYAENYRIINMKG